MPTPDLSALFTLDEIREVFGSEIAGNHTVHFSDFDGWEYCSCVAEIKGTEGVLYFQLAPDAADWCVLSRKEFRQAKSDLNNCQSCGEPDCWPICSRCERDSEF